MRVIALMSLVVMFMIGQWQVCSAEAPAPGKPNTVKSAGRIGSLSPDEERRAARARKRAATAHPPAHVAEVRHDKEAAPPRPAPRTLPPHAPIKTARADHPAPIRVAKAIPLGRKKHVAASEPKRIALKSEAHHVRLHDAPPARRAFAGWPNRSSRVGDVVPRGVPLYPIPPDYDRAEFQPEPPPPQPQFFPPFPRARYDVERE